MPTTYVVLISLLLAGVVGILAVWGVVVIESSTWLNTPGPTGDGSSSSPRPTATPPPRKPSIERSETNSTVSITVQANPARPLAYTVEPVNGSSRLVKLTVLYEQSLDDSELAILKYVDSVSSTPTPELAPQSPDDPAWIAKIHDLQEKL
jgi:hypothetical protein